MDLFARWRADIAGELEAARLAGEAALTELSEAQAAERTVAECVAAAQPAITALAARIEEEQAIAAREVTVLRRAPAPLATAVRLRFDEFSESARGARRRVMNAQNVVAHCAAQMDDLRRALDQLDMLTPADSGEVAAA